MSAHMDDIKRSVCDQIQAACDRVVVKDKVAEAHHLSALETMIRVSDPDQGPRYFSVKVTEKL